MEQRFAIFGDLERDIMEVVWTRRSATVRDVLTALRASRSCAYTTVMTVMNRLVEKGILRRKPEGQSYRYTAAATKEVFLDRSSRQVVETFVRQFGDLALAHFVDVIDDVSPAKLAALRRKFRGKT